MEFIDCDKSERAGKKSENKFINYLKRVFAKRDCIIWSQRPLHFQDPITKSRRKPDVFILDKQLGVIVCEVKGISIYQIESIQNGIWNLKNFYCDKMSPVNQAETPLFAYFNQLEKNVSKLRGRCKGSTLIALPEVSASEWKTRNFNNFDDCEPFFADNLNEPLDCFIKKLSYVKYNRGDILSEEEWTLLKAYSGAGACNRSIHDDLAKADNLSKKKSIIKLKQNVGVFDSEQEEIAKQIPPGPQRIHGIAGSGKTILLCQKAAAMHVEFPDWKIAFVFWSRTLYEKNIEYISKYIEEFSTGEMAYDPHGNLEILHAWGAKGQPGFISKLVQRCGKKNPIPLKGMTPTDSFGKGVQSLRNDLLDITPFYDCILIDEGQDLIFNDEFKKYNLDEDDSIQPFYSIAYDSLKQVGSDPSMRRLVWAYDELQSLTTPKIPSAKEILGKSNPRIVQGIHQGGIKKSYIMKKCYRTPLEILFFAHAIGMGLYREGGMLSGMTTQKDWECIGYEVEGSFKKGHEITISRPEVNSPIKVETDIDLIKFKILESRNDEAEYLADLISDDIKKQELECDRDILIINLIPQGHSEYWNSINTVADALQTRGIDYFFAQSELPNSMNPQVRGKNQNKFWHKGAVTISNNLYTVKGNEAYMVYIFGLDYIGLNESSLEARSAIFTALTRSKAWVTLTGIGNFSFYDELVSVYTDIKLKKQVSFIYNRAPQRDIGEEE